MGTRLVIVAATLFVGVVIADWLYAKYKREGFTVHLENKPQCIIPIEETTDNINVPLQPNTVRWAVTGYNYQEVPIFYRDEEKIEPIEYAWNSNGMTYYFTLAAPEGPLGSRWVMSTFDYVQPRVVDQGPLIGLSGGPEVGMRELDVSLVRRRYGYNLWEIKY